jgi:hypothetical protein
MKFCVTIGVLVYTYMDNNRLAKGVFMLEEDPGSEYKTQTFIKLNMALELPLGRSPLSSNIIQGWKNILQKEVAVILKFIWLGGIPVL